MVNLSSAISDGAAATDDFAAASLIDARFGIEGEGNHADWTGLACVEWGVVYRYSVRHDGLMIDIMIVDLVRSPV